MRFRDWLKEQTTTSGAAVGADSIAGDKGKMIARRRKRKKDKKYYTKLLKKG